MGAETPRYETSEQRQEARLAAIQNDFAGRIANRVMQTGPAIRETLVAMLTGVWYIMVYGTTALILLASADPVPVLALPVALWFAGYFLLLRILVPRMRDRSKEVSEGRSMLTGRIVDSYTNILTVKLFARAREDPEFKSYIPASLLTRVSEIQPHVRLF
jgi:ATP-binding cassette subfamily B multidrug efflux pump